LPDILHKFFHQIFFDKVEYGNFKKREGGGFRDRNDREGEAGEEAKAGLDAWMDG
jgi:hypothetical protein